MRCAECAKGSRRSSLLKWREESPKHLTPSGSIPPEATSQTFDPFAVRFAFTHNRAAHPHTLGAGACGKTRGGELACVRVPLGFPRSGSHVSRESTHTVPCRHVFAPTGAADCRSARGVHSASDEGATATVVTPPKGFREPAALDWLRGRRRCHVRRGAAVCGRVTEHICVGRREPAAAAEAEAQPPIATRDGVRDHLDEDAAAG